MKPRAETESSVSFLNDAADRARALLRCAVLRPLDTSPNHPGSVVRCFGAAHPPAWLDVPEPMPDGNLLNQPEPDFEFDQNVSW